MPHFFAMAHSEQTGAALPQLLQPRGWRADVQDVLWAEWANYTQQVALDLLLSEGGHEADCTDYYLRTSGFCPALAYASTRRILEGVALSRRYCPTPADEALQLYTLYANDARVELEKARRALQREPHSSHAQWCVDAARRSVQEAEEQLHAEEAAVRAAARRLQRFARRLRLGPHKF